MEQHQILKARVCIRGLLSKILRSSSECYEIQSGGSPREVLHVTKTKNVRKLELNTSDNFMSLRTGDFFACRCSNNIYTM